MDYVTITKLIYEKLGIADMPQDLQEQVMAEISGAILERIMIRVVTLLHDDEIVPFNKALETGDFEGVLTMLDANHPEMDTIVLETIDAVIQDFKDGMNS